MSRNVRFWDFWYIIIVRIDVRVIAPVLPVLCGIAFIISWIPHIRAYNWHEAVFPREFLRFEKVRVLALKAKVDVDLVTMILMDGWKVVVDIRLR